jgi:hypothetical protein
MEAVKTIFSNAIEEHRESSNLFTIVCELVFDLTTKKLQNLPDEAAAQAKLAQLFGVFTDALQESGLKDSKTITAVIEGLIKAASNDKKQYLLRMIYEKEQLENAIYKQTLSIKQLITTTYDTVESAAAGLEGAQKRQVIDSLKDAKLLNVEMLGILKEAAEEAFITTIEKAYDIEDTVREISKNFVYQAINEGRFEKDRILGIAGVVIEAACDISDGDYAAAPAVLNGAAQGAKEGIAKALARYRNDMRFAPEEVKAFLEEHRIEAIGLEEEYIELLERAQAAHAGISAKILSSIIERQTTYLAKLSRLSAAALLSASEKFEEFRDEGFDELKGKAGKKFEEFKKISTEKAAAWSESATPKARQMADDAKNLGFRAWEAAKVMLDDTLKTVKAKSAQFTTKLTEKPSDKPKKSEKPKAPRAKRATKKGTKEEK